MSGRDLEVAIATRTDRFQLDGPADQLDDLADAALAADRALDRVNLTRTTRDVTRLGDESRQAARDVDTAFDGMAASARQGADKLGVETGKAKRKLKDVGDEAKDTARETAASFSSIGSDMGDAAQEIAANAGGLFGPVGLAIGGALSAGIALFRANAEELKQTAETILADMLDAGGKVTTAAVEKRLAGLGLKVNDLAADAARAKVDVSDFLLAASGDPAAIQRTTEALNAQRQKVIELAQGQADGADQIAHFEAQTRNVQNVLGQQASALELSRNAMNAHAAATARANQVTNETETVMARATAAYRAAERDLSRPIVVPVAADTTAFYAALNQARAAAKRVALDDRPMP